MVNTHTGIQFCIVYSTVELEDTLFTFFHLKYIFLLDVSFTYQYVPNTFVKTNSTFKKYLTGQNELLLNGLLCYKENISLQ